MTSSSPRTRLFEAIDQIEEGYEFLLAYAAQGYQAEQSTGQGGQLRSLLDRMTGAVSDLEGLIREVSTSGPHASPEIGAFGRVVSADAARALTALHLVQAQRSISSQLVDNLNASVHLRALLTDLFLLGEIVAPGTEGAAVTKAEPGADRSASPGAPRDPG
jgi:hypothetical protein